MNGQSSRATGARDNNKKVTGMETEYSKFRTMRGFEEQFLEYREKLQKLSASMHGTR